MRDSNAEVNHKHLGVKDLGIPLHTARTKYLKSSVGISLVIALALVGIAAITFRW